MSALEDTEYKFIRELVYQRSRISLGPDRKELVATRLDKRLRKLQLNSYADYCELLRTDAGVDEVTNLVDVISTNYTSFFREMQHFEFMTQVVLPEWRSRPAHPPAEPFRAWSAPCSSGEEPYSIAITLADFFADDPTVDWHIEASDISTRKLSDAEHGIYEMERVQLPQPAWLRVFFSVVSRDGRGTCACARSCANGSVFVTSTWWTRPTPSRRVFI